MICHPNRTKKMAAVKIVKKRTKSFRRFQKSTLSKTKGNYFIRLRTGWRRPRGIDNRARRKFRGTTILPGIGYGSCKKTKHMLPSGQYKFTVRNAAEVDMLMMHNTKFSVEMAHNCSIKTRKAVVERAEQLGLKVLNKFSRVAKAESE